MVKVLMETLTTRLFSAAAAQKSKVNGILKGKRPGGHGNGRCGRNIPKLSLLHSEIYSLKKHLQELSKRERKLDESKGDGVEQLCSQWLNGGSLTKLSRSVRRKTYHEIIACLIDLTIHGRLDPAEAMSRSIGLLHEMKRDRSTPPNVYTYNLMIQCMYLNTSPESIRSHGFATSNCYTSSDDDSRGIDCVSCNAKQAKTISASKEDVSIAELDFKLARVRGYLKLLNEMKDAVLKKSQPNVYTYNLLLKCFCSLLLEGGGLKNEIIVQNCVDIFSDMRKNKQTQPDIVTFSTIMRTLHIVGSKSRCSKTIDLIIELYRQCKICFVPNKVVKSIALNAVSLRIIRGDSGSASMVLSITEDIISLGSDDMDRMFYRMTLDSWMKLACTGNAYAIDRILLILEHAVRPPILEFSNFYKFHALYSSSLVDIVIKKVLESCTSPRDLENLLITFDNLKDGKSSRNFINFHTFNIFFKALYLSSFGSTSLMVYHRYSTFLTELMVSKSVEISKMSYCSIFHGLLNLFQMQNDRLYFELCLNCFQRMSKRDHMRLPSAEIVLLEFLFSPDDQ